MEIRSVTLLCDVSLRRPSPRPFYRPKINSRPSGAASVATPSFVCVLRLWSRSPMEGSSPRLLDPPVDESPFSLREK